MVLGKEIIMANSKPINFLLVEDDDAHAKLTTLVFKQMKIDNPIIRVKDGDEAIRYIRKEGEFANTETPGVILLDLNIPGKNGLDVFKTLKDDPKLRTIPVVILTTSRSLSDRQQSYLCYANSYVVKPVDAEKFKQMAREIGLYWGSVNVPPDDNE